MSDFVSKFNLDGFVVLQDVLDVGIVNQLHTLAMGNYEELQNKLKTEKRALGIGIKHGYKVCKISSYFSLFSLIQYVIFSLVCFKNKRKLYNVTNLDSKCHIRWTWRSFQLFLYVNQY